MAAAKSRAAPELLIPKKWSAERTGMVTKWVDVIYYISRNGQLEHPHFIKVPLSSSNGLYLRDVIHRLNSLRGHGMGCLYSWSSKRSYKNGYVWQDLSEEDLIHPASGHDYVLKGSEILHAATAETACSRTNKSEEHREASSTSAAAAVAGRRRRNQSWSSFENQASDDLRREYMVVYKCESSRDFAAAAADAATQTEEKRAATETEEIGNKSVELSGGDLSPPPTMSSSDGSVGLAASGDVDVTDKARDRTAVVEGSDSVGKIRAFMQLLTCGSSIGLKLYGSMKNKKPNMKAQLNSFS